MIVLDEVVVGYKVEKMLKRKQIKILTFIFILWLAFAFLRVFLSREQILLDFILKPQKSKSELFQNVGKKLHV